MIRVAICDDDIVFTTRVEELILDFGRAYSFEICIYFDGYTLLESMRQGNCFDIIFMDPPYAGGFYEPVLKEILNAGILSFKICISIIPISAATTKAIIYIKTLQNIFAIFLYITKSFLAYFGKKKDVSIRHTLFHIFLFHWNESHIFYSLLSCLSKDNIQECLLNICRIP